MTAPPAQRPMRARWKVQAISGKDPHQFAASLEAALQELADGGWQLLGQMSRGDAHIITACRPEPVPEGPPVEARHPLRRAVSYQPKGDQYQEVLYSYTPAPGAAIVTQKCSTMVEALTLLKTHLEGGDWPLPIKIVACSMSIYEAKTIPALLKLHAKELEHGRNALG